MKSEEPKTVEKIVKSWKRGDKHKCPECGTQLSNPYYCKKDNVQLKLKMNF